MDIKVNINLYADNDGKELIRLLSGADLPTEDLTREKLKNFLVARSQDDIVIGAIGIELMKDVGLLRSLVIHPSHRRCGLGKLLTSELETFALTKGVKALYLLTRTAADFFLRSGYHITLRETVPKDIANTEEFKDICPSSAVCLHKKI